jgi:hypothetical protein
MFKAPAFSKIGKQEQKQRRCLRSAEGLKIEKES